MTISEYAIKNKIINWTLEDVNNFALIKCQEMLDGFKSANGQSTEFPDCIDGGDYIISNPQIPPDLLTNQS